MEAVELDARVWNKLAKVVAAATFHVQVVGSEKFEMDSLGRSTFSLCSFTKSCGFTQTTLSTINHYTNKHKKQYLNDYCGVSFETSRQAFEKRKIKLVVAGDDQAYIPREWLVGEL
jgi:hypothetical protein